MDRSDQLYIGLIIAGFVVSLGGLALLHPGLEDPVEHAEGTIAPYHYTVSGERYTADPGTFRTLCLGRDCVPGLYDRKITFTPVDAADEWLQDGDLVMTVKLDGNWYAFPLRVLQHHFTANTVVANQPITVTYDPYSGHTSVFSRTVSPESSFADITLSFGFSGQHWNGNMLMADQKTGTYWSQYTGEAVYGEYTGTQLERIPSNVARWSLWRERYPESSVMARPDTIYNLSRYEENPYTPYRSTRDVPVDTYTDDTPLHPKDVVYGITRGGAATAFREPAVHSDNVVQDVVGDTPVMIVQDDHTGMIYGFDRRIQGEPHNFTYNSTGNVLQDTTGRDWTVTGAPVTGASNQQALQQIDLSRMYWFSWHLFHPDTTYYQP